MFYGDQVEMQGCQVFYGQHVDRDWLEGLDDLDVSAADFAGHKPVLVFFPLNRQIGQ
jgi:hypothetical protein